MSEPPVSGDRIAFFFDYGVTVPLWDEDGLLPDEPEWLERELGLSNELIAALVEWAARQDLPGPRTVEDQDEEERLFQRLQHELSPRFTAVRSV